MAVYQYKLDHTQVHEVLTLDAAKKHLKQEDFTEDDVLIQDCIDEAISTVEEYCNISINEKVVLFTANSFQDIADLPEFKVSPIQSITAVEYLDALGDKQTLETLDTWNLLPVDKYASKLEFTNGVSTLPTVKENTYNAVQVSFIVGCAAGKTPKGLVSAIKLIVGWLYSNREDRPDKLPMASQRLMNRHIYIAR